MGKKEKKQKTNIFVLFRHIFIISVISSCIISYISQIAMEYPIPLWAIGPGTFILVFFGTILIWLKFGETR